MALFDVNWSAPLSSVAGTVVAGSCLVPTANGYVLATASNRVTYGRPDGIAVTSGDSSNPVVMIQTGPLTATQSGLSAGAASPIRVSSAGFLERVTTPSSSDEVVGYCETDGRAHVAFGVLTHRVYVDSGGGGGSTSPGGSSGDLQYNNAGAFGGITPGTGVTTWLTVPSGANLASALTSALPVSKGGTGLTALTIPASALLVGTTDAQTLTNKTIAGASNTLTVRIANDVTGLGTNVATFLATPSGANLASALSSALPDTKGGTGLTALGSGVATFLGTPSSANLAAALTGETGTGGVVFDTSPTISAPTLSSTPTLSGASTSTSNNAKGTAKDVNPVNVQTTDATVTTLDSFTIASNSAVAVSWLVTAIKSDSSQAASYSVSACFKNAAGTAAQVGTTTTTVVAESDAAWDCTADNSTTTIRLRVTGKAATTIQWTAILTSLTVVP